MPAKWKKCTELQLNDFGMDPLHCGICMLQPAFFVNPFTASAHLKTHCTTGASCHCERATANLNYVCCATKKTRSPASFNYCLGDCFLCCYVYTRRHEHPLTPRSNKNIFLCRCQPKVRLETITEEDMEEDNSTPDNQVNEKEKQERQALCCHSSCFL